MRPEASIKTCDANLRISVNIGRLTNASHPRSPNQKACDEDSQVIFGNTEVQAGSERWFV
jgi:hypothetical protein